MMRASGAPPPSTANWANEMSMMGGGGGSGLRQSGPSPAQSRMMGHDPTSQGECRISLTGGSSSASFKLTIYAGFPLLLSLRQHGVNSFSSKGRLQPLFLPLLPTRTVLPTMLRGWAEVAGCTQVG